MISRKILKPYILLMHNLYVRPSINNMFLDHSITFDYDSLGRYYLWSRDSKVNNIISKIKAISLEEAKEKLDEALVECGYKLLNSKEEVEKYLILL